MVTVDDIRKQGSWKVITHVSQYTNADYEEGDDLVVDIVEEFSAERFGKYVWAHGETMAVVKIMGEANERVVPLTAIEPITITNPPQQKQSAIERKELKDNNKNI